MYLFEPVYYLSHHSVESLSHEPTGLHIFLSSGPTAILGYGNQRHADLHRHRDHPHSEYVWNRPNRIV
jgi:hypothetical protein